MNADKTIYDFIENLHELYSIPSVALKVIQQLTDPEIKINHLAQTILNDQALTADLLKVANSGYFNFPEPISTLDKAIVLIGLKLTKEIAVSFAVKSLIKGMANVKGVNYSHLWQHAGICGIFAKKISEKLTEDGEVAFISGLLHDIGILVELLYDADLFGELLRKSSTEQIPYIKLETEHSQYNHAEIGRHLLKKWNIPDNISIPVGLHHFGETRDKSITFAREGSILHLANIYAHVYMEQNESLLSTVLEEQLQILTLTAQEVPKMYSEFSVQIDEEKERFSLLEF